MSSIILSLALAKFVLGDFTPVAPGPGESFTAGSDCTLKWDADPTGLWTNVTIDIMSGSNDNMTVVTNVASSLDGTDPSLSPFNWTCPEVDPYSDIYFYQFTNGDNRTDSKWTARFTIASPSNISVPPQYPQQPNGDPVPWGNGVLISNSSATSEKSKFASGSANITDTSSTGSMRGPLSTASGTSVAPSNGTSASLPTQSPVPAIANAGHDPSDQDATPTESPIDDDDSTKTVHHEHSTERSKPTDAADSDKSGGRATMSQMEKVDATAASPSPTSTDNSDTDNDDSDDDGTDMSNMTSIFMTSSRMKKMPTSQTQAESSATASKTGDLAPTVGLPSKKERVEQPSPSGTAAVTDGTNGVNLANGIAPRFRSSLMSTWLYAVPVAALAL